MMPLALALLQQAAHRSLAYEITVALAMLSVCVLLAAASLDGAEERRECDGPIREDAPDGPVTLDAHEEKGYDGPCREAAPECYTGED